MKKYIIRVICFICIFMVLLLGVQSVLHYRWTEDDGLFDKYIDYADSMQDSVDVLYFGTSELWYGIDPLLIFHEEGITGYNFACRWRSAQTVYYQLLYALKCHKPKVVACDFACLFQNYTPQVLEQIYRKTADTMPDWKIKNALIKDICRMDAEQDLLSWYFPVFRYHDMWAGLTESNFKKDYRYHEDYRKHTKGAAFITGDYNGTIGSIHPDLWDARPQEAALAEGSVEYYDKFIEECQSRGIKVLAVMPPKISEAGSYTALWEQKRKYFVSRGVDYLNYNTYEQMQRMGAELDADYLEDSHMNLSGSMKLSRVLAADLKEKYAFGDKRRDGRYFEEWTKHWPAFQQEAVSRQDRLDKYTDAIKQTECSCIIAVRTNDALLAREGLGDLYKAGTGSIDGSCIVYCEKGEISGQLLNGLYSGSVHSERLGELKVRTDSGEFHASRTDEGIEINMENREMPEGKCAFYWFAVFGDNGEIIHSSEWSVQNDAV